MSFTEMALKELTDIQPGEFTFSHGALTFTGTPKFKYVIVSGLYSGYPIYTDSLIGTLKTLFKEVGEYEMQLYHENQEEQIEDEEYSERCFEAEILSVNGREIEINLDTMTALLDTELFRSTEPCTIEDVCGSNYGSGIYVGE